MHVARERPLVALAPVVHAPHELAAAEARQRQRRWWAWTRSCGLGAALGPVLAGLGLLALASRVPHPRGASSAGAVGAAVAMLATGGALVAWSQWRVLVPRFTGVSALGWSVATIVAAASTVAAVRVAAMLGAASPRGAALLLAGCATAVSGGGAGALVGVAQWLVLRHGARRATGWIGANALAWGIGVPVVFVATRAAAAFPLPVAVVVALAGAGAAGLLVGSVTGRAFVRMPPRLHLVRDDGRPDAGRARRRSSG